MGVGSSNFTIGELVEVSLMADWPPILKLEHPTPPPMAEGPTLESQATLKGAKGKRRCLRGQHPQHGRWQRPPRSKRGKECKEIEGSEGSGRFVGDAASVGGDGH